MYVVLRLGHAVLMAVVSVCSAETGTCGANGSSRCMFVNLNALHDSLKLDFMEELSAHGHVL